MKNGVADKNEPPRHGLALVTGGGRGIGEACCRALAAEGFTVAVHYNTSKTEAGKVAAGLPGAFAVGSDLTDPEQIDALVRDLKKRSKTIDVLVNNAGINRNAPTAMMKLEDFDTVAALERGTWYLTKSVLRRFMLRARKGRIINISSVVGHTGNAGQTPYTMAKASLDAMTKSLAQETAGTEILINSVAPGFINTSMTTELPAAARERILSRIPLGRMGTPAEVAEVVAFLATQGGYIHGSIVHVNGGMYGG